MPFADVGDVRLYYEFTGPEDAPLILQFGGSLFGRANFNSVNDGFRENFPSWLFEGVDLAAGLDCFRYFVALGRCEHEDHMRGWFFQCF